MCVLLVVNKQAVMEWNRYFKKKYLSMDIDVIDFETLYVSDNIFLEQYSVTIVCIEKYMDLFKYVGNKECKRAIRRIHLIGRDKKLFRKLISHSKILYEGNRLKESVEGLLNVIRGDNFFSINCDDVLDLASKSELLCQGAEGTKDALMDMIANWKTSECLRSCLVNIVGEITLKDVDEICTMLQTSRENKLLTGVRYEETKTISVFLLWKWIV